MTLIAYLAAIRAAACFDLYDTHLCQHRACCCAPHPPAHPKDEKRPQHHVDDIGGKGGVERGAGVLKASVAALGDRTWG
jgi:hypothetical protein